MGSSATVIGKDSMASMNMLGSKDEIRWRQTDDGLALSVPREKPCRHAFVYRVDFHVAAQRSVQGTKG